ncbi:hypothetical protein GF312_21625, partial [Candidatus Poribacteria bacterium]|nr:hypothetical protein [Candidatus Poribacteria bacterium]
LKEVRQVLEGWQLAWKMSDADTYTSYYWHKAEIRKIIVSDGKEQIEEFDVNQMRRQMENIFSQGPSYKIGEPKLEAGSDAARATFEFFKETPAEAYNKDIIKHDKWIKELLFKKIKGNWKIVRENWNIYKGIPEYTRKW